jgi:predicted Fe-Mo cluster-binding NifX family protein
MKVALATWNGRISPVFDVARQVLLVDIDGGRVVARREESLPGTESCEQSGRVVGMGAQVLICGAVSQPMADLLATANVRVIPFTAGTIDEVLDAWLTGSLPCRRLSMPGCFGRRGRCRGGRGVCRHDRGEPMRSGDERERELK